jgi:hypothetical protein
VTPQAPAGSEELKHRRRRKCRIAPAVLIAQFATGEQGRRGDRRSNRRERQPRSSAGQWRLQMNPRAFLAQIILSVSILACAALGPRAESPEPIVESATQPAPPQDEAIPPQAPPPAASTGRDFSTINICELIPAQEVADLAGGTVYGEPNQSSDPMFSLCWYEVEAPDGAYEYYIVYVESVELGEFAISMGDLGDAVGGLGDEAYLKYEDGEEQFRLLVMRAGDFAIDIAGSRADVMQEIARLLLQRL